MLRKAGMEKNVSVWRLERGVMSSWWRSPDTGLIYCEW